MRTTLPVLLALLVAAACASPERTPAARMSADQLHSYCESRMYTDRNAHPRGAVNWTIYDRCMRQRAGD